MKIEELGVSMDEIADKVLEETAPIAVEAYRSNVPYDETEYDSIHARNNVHPRTAAIRLRRAALR